MAGTRKLNPLPIADFQLPIARVARCRFPIPECQWAKSCYWLISYRVVSIGYFPAIGSWQLAIGNELNDRTAAIDNDDLACDVVGGV